jgi:heat shock protein HslJ
VPKIQVSLLLAAALGLALPADAVHAQSAAAGGDLNATLKAYRWSLDSATDGQKARIDAVFPPGDRRFVFGFAGGRLSVKGGCNTMTGSYAITPARQLKTGRMAATMMACEPALMQADAALSKLLAQPLGIEVVTGQQPQLRLVATTGEALMLTGTATPETLYGPGTRMFLEVAARPVPCHKPMIPDATCLQVRERHFGEDGLPSGAPGKWRPLYENIEGFTHQEGVRNVLRVKRFKRSHPPADASANVYVLDLIVESEVVR